MISDRSKLSKRQLSKHSVCAGNHIRNKDIDKLTFLDGYISRGRKHLGSSLLDQLGFVLVHE